MSISCGCDFDKDDYDSWYYNPSDFSALSTTTRRRCKSCKDLIDIGSVVVEFENFRHPTDEIEERCKGDEIQTASFFMCEKCGEIFLNLAALGFCMDVCFSSMQECLADYHKMTGFKQTA